VTVTVGDSDARKQHAKILIFDFAKKKIFLDSHFVCSCASSLLPGANRKRGNIFSFLNRRV
jgi:hypothetical protein